MTMRLRHRIGITLVDKMILAGALFLCVLDVSAGFTDITMDLFSIVAVVVIAYIGVVIFVSFITFFMRTEGRGVDFVKGLLSALLIFLLYPKILGILFWIMGSSVSPYVETILLWTFVIRTFLSVWLGRRWQTVGE